ncbi:hypothetical protein BC830DRAFT_1166991 [Chytriomyces sp. MP71]|nr:hypothetical protein BC830DRAFT_1166991 [Chytriomyces sp. MP71]
MTPFTLLPFPFLALLAATVPANTAQSPLLPTVPASQDAMDAQIGTLACLTQSYNAHNATAFAHCYTAQTQIHGWRSTFSRLAQGRARVETLMREEFDANPHVRMHVMRHSGYADKLVVWMRYEGATGLPRELWLQGSVYELEEGTGLIATELLLSY